MPDSLSLCVSYCSLYMIVLKIKYHPRRVVVYMHLLFIELSVA